MRSFLWWISGLGLLIAAASCQKVIDLKVGDSTPRIFIEGRVTDSLQPWTVHVSRTLSYTASNNVDAVRSARVSIQDLTAGTTDSLFETAPGIYATPGAKTGISGHTYALRVETGEETFTAASTLPGRVPIDSVRVEVSGAFGRKAAQIFVEFTDPPGIPNYYRFALFANGKRQSFDTRDDRYTDGRINGRPSILAYDDDKNIGSGTLVTIEMEGIDAAVYKYFSTIRNADGNSAAPANPVSNIQGGALGYFSATSVQEARIVLP